MEISVKNILLLCILILSFTTIQRAHGEFYKYGEDMCLDCLYSHCQSAGCYLCKVCSYR